MYLFILYIYIYLSISILAVPKHPPYEPVFHYAVKTVNRADQMDLQDTMIPVRSFLKWTESFSGAEAAFFHSFIGYLLQ